MTQGPLSTELPPEPGDAEARLRLLRDRLEIALRATNDGLWDWDLIEDKVYFSPRFRELLGYDDEQAFHQDFVLRSSLHPDDRDAAAGDIDRHVHGDGPPLDRVYRLRCRDQRYRWFHGRGRVLRGPDGRAQHFAGAITDVTERVLAEEALRASEQRFRELTELSADWFWEQDADLRFTRMIGHTADNMITTPAQHIGLYRWDLPHVDMSDEVWQRHREQLQRHEPFRDFEIRRLDNKGRLTVLHTSGKPVFDAQGTFIGYHGVGRNVTLAAPGRDAAIGVGGAAARIAEDGGRGHAGRWHRARLQQHPRRHLRPPATGPTCPGRRASRGRSSGPDRPLGAARACLGAADPHVQPPWW
ncbi:MAG: PAS domain-containing protein [Ideonella sp.]|nr:PAS domain-containing protein [Ideonella sp.]